MENQIDHRQSLMIAAPPQVPHHLTHPSTMTCTIDHDKCQSCVGIYGDEINHCQLYLNVARKKCEQHRALLTYTRDWMHNGVYIAMNT